MLRCPRAFARVRARAHVSVCACAYVRVHLYVDGAAATRRQRLRNTRHVDGRPNAATRLRTCRPGHPSAHEGLARGMRPIAAPLAAIATTLAAYHSPNPAGRSNVVPSLACASYTRPRPLRIGGRTFLSMIGAPHAICMSKWISLRLGKVSVRVKLGAR